MKYYFLLLCIGLLLACDKDGNGSLIDVPDPSGSDAPNILFIIGDDIGKDALSGFEEGIIKANTPNLDKIRNEGLVFNNFWAYPTCSPTRSSILSGQYGYRTGVLNAGGELSTSEKSIHQYITEQSEIDYSTAVIGKWHLSGSDDSVNPESFGIDYYTGILSGAVNDFFRWRLKDDDSNTLNTEYITKVFTDLSKDWINQQTKPWFLWLAHTAAHTPFHVPPSDMHSQGDLPEYTEDIDPLPYYLAAIEAMDFQIGELINSIPEQELDNTIIIFLGDNGTPNQVAQSPFTNQRAKGSLYQGGINVPFFVSGKGIDRVGEDNNMISSVDLFSTLANIAGVNASTFNDSQSFYPLFKEENTIREYQYSEQKTNTKDEWTIRNDEFKLIIDINGDEQMYNLLQDPYEVDNLLNSNLNNKQSNAKIALEAELNEIRN